MIELLIVNNYNVIPSTYILTIKDFKVLYDRDRSKDKGNAIKEFAYIYFYCDHNSPFMVYSLEERIKEVIISVYGENVKWKPDSKVKTACATYIKLKETSAVRLLKSATASVTKLENYFKDIDLTLMDDNGKPIFNAKDLVMNLSKVGDVVQGLSKLEELVKKEEQKSSKVRGGVEINKYSQ
tara:strand:- start:190 stop:735 length:546 start_codon:yes stop_codon:yes gene_type:complete